MILDSTFLIDLLDSHNAAQNKLEELVEMDSRVAVSPLSVYEAGLGLRDDEREAFAEILSSMVVHSLGLAESHRALSIQRTLYGRGEPIGDVDSLIAATAAESADPRILTRNVDEFTRVEGIDVETY